MEPPYTQQSGVPIQRRPIARIFDSAENQCLKAIVPFKKNELSIEIHDHFASKRYRPGSVVKGTVSIKPRKQMPFGSLSIKFVCDSSVENFDTQLPLETWHRLLDLEMPVPRHALPESKILLPGQTYTVPFYFVLPESLGTIACTHKITAGETRHLHCQPPPSSAGWERDAMIPKDVCIEYGVLAQLLDSGTPQYSKLESKHTIQFLPAFFERPPLSIPVGNQTYRLKSSKELKKNLFSRSTGKMTLSANQPQALILHTNGYSFRQTIVFADLFFDSFEAKHSLPGNCSISVKLESETWCEDEPMQQCPHIIDRRGAHSHTENILKKMDMDLAWEPSTENQAGKKAGQSIETFKSRLEIPLIDFASCKRFLLPTFYSCLVARTYQLQITVQVATVSLKVVLPIQLCMEDTMEAMAPEHLDIGLDACRDSECFGMLPSYNDVASSESEASTKD